MMANHLANSRLAANFGQDQFNGKFSTSYTFIPSLALYRAMEFSIKAWVKVFRIIPEFRILRLIFYTEGL